MGADKHEKKINLKGAPGGEHRGGKKSQKSLCEDPSPEFPGNGE